MERVTGMVRCRGQIDPLGNSGIQIFAADREGQQLMGGFHSNKSSEHSFSSFSSLRAALAHSIATLSRSSHNVAN